MTVFLQEKAVEPQVDTSMLVRILRAWKQNAEHLRDECAVGREDRRQIRRALRQAKRKFGACDKPFYKLYEKFYEKISRLDIDDLESDFDSLTSYCRNAMKEFEEWQIVRTVILSPLGEEDIAEKGKVLRGFYRLKADGDYLEILDDSAPEEVKVRRRAARAGYALTYLETGFPDSGYSVESGVSRFVGSVLHWRELHPKVSDRDRQKMTVLRTSSAIPEGQLGLLEELCGYVWNQEELFELIGEQKLRALIKELDEIQRQLSRE